MQTAIFALGSNGSGQLGIGHDQDVSVPKNIIFPESENANTPLAPFKKFAAGGNHSLLLLENGNLLSSGDLVSGARGLSTNSRFAHCFEKVKLSRSDDNGNFGGQGISMVAATWEASLLVAKDEQGKNTKLMSFGIGLKGELGTGQLIVRSSEASLVKGFPPPNTEIVDISACMGHAVVVLSNGDAYGWGNCRKSQAGEPAEILYSPRKIDGVHFKVTRAICCKESTCLFGESGSGNLLVIGSDKHGLKSTAPGKAPAWKDVGASWGNIFILKDDGSLIAWGRDDHGQMPPPNLPPVEKIAVGSEHVVALTEEGEVVSWGWGEHGNCGPLKEGTDVKGKWNTLASSKYLPKGTRFTNIGAGCATSWICIETDQ